MPVKIENSTNKPVMLRFNSGQTIYLGPKVTSKEIMDVEVKNNHKVQKLKDRHIITLHEVKEEKPPASPKKEQEEET
jgi:hypothetical protein